MNSVLFAFTQKPMLSSGCSSYAIGIQFGLMCLQEVLDICMQNLRFIVYGRYRLLGNFFNLKAFSFIRSIEVPTTKSRQSLNKYGAYVYHSKTPIIMSNKLIYQSGKIPIAFVFS